MNPEQIKKFTAMLKKIGEGKAKGFIYMGEITRHDAHHEQLDGLVYTNEFSKREMLERFIENTNTDPIELLALVAKIAKKI